MRLFLEAFDARVAVCGVSVVAGLLAGVLLLAGGACLVWRKRKRGSETDSLAPHILVYPSYQGDSAPQLM